MIRETSPDPDARGDSTTPLAGERMTTLLRRPPLKPRHEIFRVERILLPEVDLPHREHKVIAVLPAYNAESTLAATLADIPVGAVDEVLLVDDGSTDRTVQVAREMGLTVIQHPQNRGYGGNQKTCYKCALEHGAANAATLAVSTLLGPVAGVAVVDQEPVQL